MKRSLTMTLAAACALATPVVASAGPSSAGTGAPVVARASGVQAVPAGEWSHSLAGYRTFPPGGVTSVVVKAVTAPPMTCSDKFEGIAVGAGSEPIPEKVEYFAGVIARCVHGDAVYTLDAIAGDVEEQTSQVAAGDQVQVVISVNCDSSPCDVFASATNLDADDSTAEANGTLTQVSGSALYGEFPVYSKRRPHLARVPDFGTTPVLGCLINGASLEDARRVKRRDRPINQILPGPLVDLSFELRFVHR